MKNGRLPPPMQRDTCCKRTKSCSSSPSRNTYIIREHHITVLIDNHISTFYMKLCVNDRSYIKYTYIISRNQMVLFLPPPITHTLKSETISLFCLPLSLLHTKQWSTAHFHHCSRRPMSPLLYWASH